MYFNGCLCSGLFVTLSAVSSVITLQDYPKLLDYTLVLRYIKKSTTDILLYPNMQTYEIFAPNLKYKFDPKAS